jgi:TPR repeat protein
MHCGILSAERGNMTESMQWFTLSAAQGNSRAQRELGRWFLEGESKSISPSLFKAYYWFKKAALQGDCIAQGHMASLLL